MNGTPDSYPKAAWSRRRFLTTGAAAGLGLGAAALLGGCTGDSSSAVPAPSGSATPRRGGQLRVGMIGAGKSESFNPSVAASTLICMAMASAVYDPLLAIGQDLKPLPGLATTWTPNADSTAFTFVLRPGVTWHDGTPLTSADVVYTLRWMNDPTNQLSASVVNIDFDELKAPSPDTVVINLKSPDVGFPLTIGQSFIIQDGTKDFSKPVGTGPFVFESLTPGQQSSCKRNPAYWQKGKPYVDSLVIKSLTDDTARMNALLANDIDVMAQLPFALAKANEERGITLLNSPGLGAQSFYMAIDQEPFTDVRVRQAIKLLADRQALVDVALSGYGTVANDLFGQGMQFYASDIPQRSRDVAKAKDLLAQAGHGSGLQLTLETSPVAPGMVEAATLFAQQAAEGGVTIQVQQVDPASYFDPTVKYLKMPFAQSYWSGFVSLGSIYPYMFLPDGAGNETHWVKPETTTAINAAVSAPNEAEATADWLKIQQEQFDDGGYLWWANVNNLDATSSRVAGVTANKLWAMGLPGSLADAYLTS